MGRAAQFDTFWDECGKYLNEEIGVAVDEQRHGTVTHLGRAISAKDLVDQVKSCCPENTPHTKCRMDLPEILAKNSSSQKHYAVHWKVQNEVYGAATAVGSTHVDSHYAAATIRYMH